MPTVLSKFNARFPLIYTRKKLSLFINFSALKEQFTVDKIKIAKNLKILIISKNMGKITKLLALLIVMLILLIGSLFLLFFQKSITGSVIADYNSWTKAICDETNYYRDQKNPLLFVRFFGCSEKSDIQSNSLLF